MFGMNIFKHSRNQSMSTNSRGTSGNCRTVFINRLEWKKRSKLCNVTLFCFDKEISFILALLWRSHNLIYISTKGCCNVLLILLIIRFISCVLNFMIRALALLH